MSENNGHPCAMDRSFDENVATCPTLGTSFFATRPVSQMSITFFLLEVGSSMIALFKALIWLYNTYYR